jgi:hypothetical protein
VSWLPLLAIAAVAFALALIPTRRLSLAGWRPAWLAAYLVVLMALALLAIELRAGIRVVVPILLVLYVAPFIGAPDRVARAIARLGAGRAGGGAGTIIDGTARPVDGSAPTDGRRDDGPGADASPAGADPAGSPSPVDPARPDTAASPDPVDPTGRDSAEPR